MNVPPIAIAMAYQFCSGMRLVSRFEESKALFLRRFRHFVLSQFGRNIDSTHAYQEERDNPSWRNAMLVLKYSVIPPASRENANSLEGFVDVIPQFLTDQGSPEMKGNGAAVHVAPNSSMMTGKNTRRDAPYFVCY
jgi:hypothetical protein